MFPENMLINKITHKHTRKFLQVALSFVVNLNLRGMLYMLQNPRTIHDPSMIEIDRANCSR